MKKLKILVVLIFNIQAITAQINFADKCIGKWEGNMEFYKKGKLLGKMPVRFTVSKKQQKDTWVWKTEYLSKKQPGVKDYLLKLIDSKQQLYLLDEGNNIVLNSYVINDKLYQVFETDGILLTSNYELINDTLIFEVSSGKKIAKENMEASSYSIDYLQRVKFKRSGK